MEQKACGQGDRGGKQHHRLIASTGNLAKAPPGTYGVSIPYFPLPRALDLPDQKFRAPPLKR